MYENGEGVNKDEGEAAKLYSKVGNRNLTCQIHDYTITILIRR